MAIKSDNIKGNPYHDESGKFTSAEGESGGIAENKKASDPLMDLFGSLMKTANELYGNKSSGSKKESSEKEKAMEMFDIETKPEKNPGEYFGMSLDEWESTKKMFDEYYRPGEEFDLIDASDIVKAVSKYSGRWSDEFAFYLEDQGLSSDKIIDFLHDEKHISDEQYQFVKEYDYIPDSWIKYFRGDLNSSELQDYFAEDMNEWYNSMR